MSLLRTYGKNKVAFEVLLKSFDGPNTLSQLQMFYGRIASEVTDPVRDEYPR